MSALGGMQVVRARPDGAMKSIVAEDTLPGWRRIAAGASVLWLKGHLHAGGESRLVAAAEQGSATLRDALPGLDGCFAIIAVCPDGMVAAADPIASIPVFLAADAATGSVLIGGQGAALARKAHLTEQDADAALSLGIAGYTFGDRALVRGLRHLRGGECAVVHPGAAPAYDFYARYRPWLAAERPRAALSDELAEILRAIFVKSVDGLHDRPIMVPLSAGYDSRLVAAALKELGHRDIRCYAYGIPGNHEAQVSRAVAERLGLRWQFVPVTPRLQSACFGSSEFAEFLRDNDTLTAIPFNQDYAATRSILQSGYAPKDAVFINGQSGDFITGNHVPRELASAPAVRDVEVRWARLFEAVRGKHFGLWTSLQTPRNLARMAAMLRADLEEQGGLPDDAALDWSLAEASEFIHRQSRYVVSGQRTYEHFGFDWRLPLWDLDLVSFYERAPLSAKLSQSLYRDTLTRLNWGGVFGNNIPVNRRNVRPLWLAPLRLAAKAAAAPFGRDRWHRIEKRYFAWHMDPVANYAVVPWSRVARDRRGFRNAIAWHAEAYLARHGVSLERLAALA